MKAGSLSGRSKDAGGPSPAPATSVEENFTEAMIDNMQHDAEQAKDMPEPGFLLGDPYYGNLSLKPVNA